MFVYQAMHQRPHPNAPVPMSTYVAPWPVEAPTIIGAISHENALPITQLEHFQLHYPQMPPDPATGLAMIEREYVHCGRCHLSTSRQCVVLFRGNPYSPIVAIGEGPGRTEDMKGKPFVGASGRLMSELFREVGIDPDRDLGWINLVGCRPVDHRFDRDRPPTLAELMACSERFLSLLRALRPGLVLLLGDHAASAFFDDVKGMYPNTWHEVEGVTFGYTRHPAYLLRVIPAAPSYKEYAAAKLFLEDLHGRMHSGQVRHSPAWSIIPRYLVDPKPAVGGSLGG